MRAVHIRTAQRAGPASDRDGYADETLQMARPEPQAEVERGRAEARGSLSYPGFRSLACIGLPDGGESTPTAPAHRPIEPDQRW